MIGPHRNALAARGGDLQSGRLNPFGSAGEIHPPTSRAECVSNTAAGAAAGSRDDGDTWCRSHWSNDIAGWLSSVNTLTGPIP